MLLASFGIHARWNLNLIVPCAPTSTPQGYTTSPLHPHPRMRMLLLVSMRRTFGQAHLWSILLASFSFWDGLTILEDIAHCGNIFICIFQLIQKYFSGQYHFITHLDHP